MAHTLLATASQEGTLQDIVCALESILNVLHSRTETKETTNRQIPDVLNANSLLSLLKSRYPNKHGELMKCVSLLFFIPAIDSSGPTGAQHKRLVNAFVSTIDSPISCAVQRGCAATVETYLALLVMSKIILSSGTSSKRFFKTADYKALTFLEWLGQVKFFGRSKKKMDDTYRALYGEWALHAGNDDDTLHVLTHNEYTLRDLTALICTSPFGRMILTRSNFFFQEDAGAEEAATMIDYDEVFATALIAISMSQPSTRAPPESEASSRVDLLSDDPVGDANASSPSEEGRADSSKSYYAPVDLVLKEEKTSNSAQPPAVGMFGDMPCSHENAVSEKQKTLEDCGDGTAFIRQDMIDAPTFGEIPETARTNPPKGQDQTAALAMGEEDYEDIRGTASIVEEEEDDDFYLVISEEYDSMAMETEWEIVSS
jgi:hypothetical protein